ncbi:hypothetical protein [Congregibacter sp.]|jgi:hypothetical protein|uniref:hypothetical protein n=1 Tax=Congregibacter sp. TaxID=2744308 RepID=UPI0039E6DFC3
MAFAMGISLTFSAAIAESTAAEIRRDKFDQALPAIMRKHKVDMWIHVTREAIPDNFAKYELGTESGVVVFIDSGEERVERMVLGRRWGSTQRQRDAPLTSVETTGAYDYIAPSVMVREMPSTPMTEHDYRFKGLSEFVNAHDPKKIAVNYIDDLGPWPTDRRTSDGISHTDYRLLANELGKRFTARIISSEYLILDYIAWKVPLEVKQLEKMALTRVANARRLFDEVEPGVTRVDESGVTIFRRMRTGQSQRGRSAGWENAIIIGGDIVAAPSEGLYGYVLKPDETDAPDEIQRLWQAYLKVEKVLRQSIRAGRRPVEIVEDYTADFKKQGIVVRANQLHMEIPKNDYPAYMKGFDPTQLHISIDSHAQMKGARPEPVETYFAPRIGSLGPDWSHHIPLTDNHHFVIEYFFYMPSPGPEGKDNYLLWWAHEEALVGKRGVKYLSPPQKELILIR